MVNVTVPLPDGLAALMGASLPQVQRRLLEDAVVEAYRLGRISRGEVASYLGQNSWHETEQFLTDREIPLAYDKHDLDHDLAVMDDFLRTK